MGAFGDLLYDLASAAGHGLEKGMGAKRKEDEQASAFKRMMPLQLEQKRGEAGVQEEYAVRGEERKRATEMADREDIYNVLGPTLERLLPPTITPAAEPQVAERPSGPQFAPSVTPFKVPKTTPLAAYGPLYTLLGKQGKEPKEPRQPTMTQIRQWAVTPGHPEQPRSKSLLDAYEQEQINVFAGKEGEKPIPPGMGEAITELEASQRRIRAGIHGATPEATKARAGKYLSPRRGATAGAREYLNQLSGGYLMDPDESVFRTAVTDIADMLLRARSGAAISEPEYRRLLKIAPNLNTPPANFLAVLAKFEEELDEAIAAKKRMAVTPRKVYLPRPRPIGLPDEFVEE